MATNNLYLDTSAYINILTKHPDYTALFKLCQNARLFSSSLLYTEAFRTLVRMAREKLIEPGEFKIMHERLNEDVHTFKMLMPNEEICYSQTMPSVSTPRSMDLMHLRTALWVKTLIGNLQFVSCDQRQLQAAAELGLVTIGG